MGVTQRSTIASELQKAESAHKENDRKEKLYKGAHV